MVFEFGSLYGGSCLSRFVIVYCWLLRWVGWLCDC